MVTIGGGRVLCPKQLGPGQLDPRAQLSGAQLSTPKKWTVGPRTDVPRTFGSRGPTFRGRELVDEGVMVTFAFHRSQSRLKGVGAWRAPSLPISANILGSFSIGHFHFPLGLFCFV